ncbi:MAG: hypothetical protein HOP12_14900 [Candidatus Eisenbacteria bacterium]|uniref:SLATT domain-containing protein n=1 Tax=Eiseniibacteriota bacterium TaxID=2212470 RepID=A0A849SLW7_UNCEI|nr:hypothetical protein [Candidatus Eisenbacteria bacterium]
MSDSAKENFELLIRQYEMVSDHYKHEDTLRLTRDQNFIVLSAALLSLVGLLTQGTVAGHGTLARIGVSAIAVLGLIICRAWSQLSDAGSLYVALRREQGAEIERKLGTLSLFRDELKATADHRERTPGWLPHGQAMRRVFLSVACLWGGVILVTWIF